MSSTSATTAIAVQAPMSRVSVTAAMADRYGMDPSAFEQTLRATVMPPNTTKEQFAAFLLVAKQYDLNPVTREIYAMPAKSGGIQPIVSVDGWLNLMNSHPQMNGLEFEDKINGDGELLAITARIWRKDRERPIVVTEYMKECRRNTPTWSQWPARMLRHKAAIQAARYAFGFAGIIEPDEYERGAEASRAAPPSATSALRAIAPPTSEIGSRAQSPPPAPPSAGVVPTPAAAPPAARPAGPPSPPAPSAKPPAGNPPPAAKPPQGDLLVEPDTGAKVADVISDFEACGDLEMLNEVWLRFEDIADTMSRNVRQAVSDAYDHHAKRIKEGV